MKRFDFNVGDKVWFYHDNHQGKKSSGTVVLKTRLPLYSFDHYIIEIPTSVDPLLIVRDGFTLSDTEGGSLGFMRKND